MGRAGWRPGRTEAWLPGSPPSDGHAQATSCLRTHGQTLPHGPCHPQWGSLILDRPARCPFKGGDASESWVGELRACFKEICCILLQYLACRPPCSLAGPLHLPLPAFSLPVSHEHAFPLPTLRPFIWPHTCSVGSVKSPLPPFVAAIMKKTRPFYTHWAPAALQRHRSFVANN